YLAWDIFERRSTRDVAEIKFYNRVIFWECGSAVLLMVCIFIDKLSIPFITDKSLASVVGLGIIAVCFIFVVYYKYKFWLRNEIKKLNA
ncbi:MAG: hypothetical protein ACHQFW_11755, partial [Chitinophagales bacterium]